MTVTTQEAVAAMLEECRRMLYRAMLGKPGTATFYSEDKKEGVKIIVLPLALGECVEEALDNLIGQGKVSHRSIRAHKDN